MRFWDASAVVPLLVSEPHSRRLDELFARGSLVVWWGTAVEVAAALARRDRSGELAPAESAESFALLDFLMGAWREVPPLRAVRQAAQRLVKVHPLRASDSLQLAAALAAAGGEPSSVEFVCLDERLRQAAAREGLRLLPESIEEP